MKKCIANFFLSLIFISLIPAFPADKNQQVIIYGNSKCYKCSSLLKNLDSEGIHYIYRDVEIDGSYQEEMYAKIKNAGYSSAALLPVADVNGRILMEPGFEDIRKALGGEKKDTEKKSGLRPPLWRPEKKSSKILDFQEIKTDIGREELIIYTDNSGRSLKLIHDLQKEELPYKEINLEKEGNSAVFNLSRKLSSLGYGNIILLPVAEFKGEMIMRPSMNDIELLIMENYNP